MPDQKERLEQTLHSQIALTNAMGIRVASYDGDELALTAPLDRNANDKGTAFAGSLYSLAVLTGWGLLFIKTAEADLAAKIMVYESTISYHCPVREDLTATCRAPAPSDLADVFQTFRETGKGKARLTVEIRAGTEVAVTFTGKFAIRT